MGEIYRLPSSSTGVSVAPRPVPGRAELMRGGACQAVNP